MIRTATSVLVTTVVLISSLISTGCGDLKAAKPEAPKTVSSGTDAPVGPANQPPLPSILSANPSLASDPQRIAGFYYDYSASPDYSEFERVLPDVAREFKEYSDSIDGVVVTRVANGNRSTLFQQPEIFWWGPPPTIEPFKEPDLSKAPADVKFFEDRKEKYIAKAKADYEDSKNRVLRARQERVDRELQRFVAYLSERPARGAPCTRFGSIGERIQQDGYPHNVFVTDGWADCPEERDSALTPVRIQSQITILQVPRKSDTASDEDALRARTMFLKSTFPGANVMPAYKVAKGIVSLFDGSNNQQIGGR